MNRQYFLRGSVWLAIFVFGISMFAGRVSATEALGVEVQLIWGTNDADSPNPKHKKIDPELAKKLEKAPYRWKNYFEVKRNNVAIPHNETKTVVMSERCKLELKNLGSDRVEIKLYGQGKLISVHDEKVAADWPLILSGDAKNDTAWLLVITKEQAGEKK